MRTMDFGQSDYLAEKGQAIRVGDQEDSYNTGLRQFLDEKSYKPLSRLKPALIEADPA